MNPNELRQKAAGLEVQARDLMQLVTGENRDMNETEKGVYQGYLDGADRLERQAKEVEALETRVAARSQGQGRQSAPVAPQATESRDDKFFETGGFRSHGHLAHALIRTGRPSGADPDNAALITEWRTTASRVTRAATGLNEASDAEGGLLIPNAYASGIWSRSQGDYQNLSSRIKLYPVTGNTMSFNADAETSRANGSRRGGVQGYWDAEAAQYTATKPTWRKIEQKLKKLTMMVYLTEEQVEDSGGMLDTYLDDCAAEETTFKINDALVNGSGAGILHGFLPAPCKVTTTAVGGQGAATIVAQNIDDMWASRWGRSERNYVWLYNQEIESPLQRMYYSTGSNSGQLVYQQPGGLANLPYATLKGREMINLEQCAALGTEGDIILWDPTQSVGIYKSSGINKAVSIHLRFDFGETVMRYSLRMDVANYWNAPLTPFKGAKKRSPIITLSSTRT